MADKKFAQDLIDSGIQWDPSWGPPPNGVVLSNPGPVPVTAPVPVPVTSGPPINPVPVNIPPGPRTINPQATLNIPPGVTPDIWNSLSPEAKAQAAARLSGTTQQMGVPPTAPTQSYLFGQGGLANKYLGWDSPLLGGGGPTYTETGGGLKETRKVGTEHPTTKAEVSEDKNDYSFAQKNEGEEFKAATYALVDRMPANIRADYDAASADGKTAILAQYKASLALARAKAEPLQAQSDFLKQSAHDRQMQMQSQQETLQAYIDQQQKMVEDVQKGEIDPGRIWHNQNGFGFAMSLIGSMMGAFGSSLTGKPNQALEMLNKQIENDIDAQKANLANKRAGIEAQDSLYAHKLQQFGNENLATDAAKADMLASLTANGDAMVAENGSAQAQADWMKNRAGLEDSLGRLHTELYKNWTRPVQTGGTAIDQKRMEEDTIKIFEGSKGTMTIDQARQAALYAQTGQGGGGALTGGAGAGGAVAPPAGLFVNPESTSWNPFRGFQWSSDFSKVEDQERFNTAIKGVMHKAFGARTPEAQAELAKPYLLDSGMSQENIDRRKAKAQADFGRPGQITVSPTESPLVQHEE